MELATAGFVEAVAEDFAKRLEAGTAIWQTDVRALSSMPLTVTDERDVPLMGGNALVLAQAMWDKGWRDPRFFTAGQVAAAGGHVRSDAAPVAVQFVRAVDADGCLLESPEVRDFSLFNAEEIDGLGPWVAPARAWSLETLAERLLPKFEVDIVHDQQDAAFFSVDDGNVHMPPMSAFASVDEYVGVAVHELSHASRGRVGRDDVVGAAGEASYAREELRAELASMQLSIALGIPHDTRRHAGFAGVWATLLREEPGELFVAARDAEKMAALVLWHVKAVEKEIAVEEFLGLGGRAPGGSGEAAIEAKEQPAAAGKGLDGEDASDSKPTGKTAAEKRRGFQRGVYARSASELFEERQAILAVPFGEKDEAKKLGAMFYGDEKVWFVPAGVDMEPFKRWSVIEGQGVTGRAPSRGEIVAEFEKMMSKMGLSTKLRERDKGSIDDGQWHNVRITSVAKSNASGRFILNVDGGRDGRPCGHIVNYISGEDVHWTMDCPGLTPEQAARLRAETIEREKAATLALEVKQSAVAVEAREIWAAATVGEHRYFGLKGVEGHGARVSDGATLLRYGVFKSNEGKTIIRANERYALIPMMDEHQKIWALQAISEDGKTKAFMSGGRKKGLFCVIGDQSVGENRLPVGGLLGFVEGFATGASVHEATGMPVCVCFDAGNMEAVAKDVGQRLAPEVKPVIAADCDQFFMERAFGALARIGVVAHGGTETVKVVTGPNGMTRDVALGEVVANGEWQQATGGRYRVVLEDDKGVAACVGKVRVEIIRAGAADGVRENLIAGNRGLDAARVAAEAMRGAVVVVPQFATLKGRPTDWNDLAKLGGDVRGQVNEQMGIKEMVVEKVRAAGRGGR